MASKLKLTELLYPTSTTAAITINSDDSVTIPTQSTTNLAYTGTLTGGTGVVNLGSGQVYKDASGNVGFGNTSPAYNLDVNASNATAARGYAVRLRSNATATAATIQFTNNAASTENGYITVNDSLSMLFGTGSSAKVAIDASGNVGIGTSSPTFKLQIQSGASTILAGADSAATTLTDNTQKVMRFGVPHYTNAEEPVGALFVSNTISASALLIGGGTAQFNAATVLQFYTAANNTTVTGSERMRIESSGNVGIGTTSPQAKLAVSNGGAAGLEFFVNYPGGGVGTYIQSYNRSSPGYVNTAYDALSHSFRITGTERAQIDSSGNLLVGTTTNFGKLSVFGTAGFNADANSAISGSGSFKYRGGAGATTITTWDYLNYTAMQFIRDNGNPTNTVGSITCTDTATSYNTSSDYRLKENVAPMTGALATVAALKPCTYTWKADGSDGQGFIAHELQAVVPDCVTGTKDAIDKDGNPQHQGVDTSFLVATLTAAIQELKAEVDALKGAA
jgi:hypothetical protein